MFQQAIMNTLKINGKIKSLSKETEEIKKDKPNRNVKLKYTIT